MKNRKKIIGQIWTYLKKIMLFLYVVLGKLLAFGGFIMLFLLFFEKEYIINEGMAILTYREAIIGTIGFIALFLFECGNSILKEYEYKFLKEELKNKYNIKIQGGAIVNEEN